MHVLFVCTGNICRSPIAERLTAAYSEAERDTLGGTLTARSAGTAAVVDHPMERSAALVLQGLGGSPEGFVARQLTIEDIEPADLVFTMTRRQRAAVLQMAPRMMSRTFTLREAASLLTTADSAHLAYEPDLDSRGRQLAATLAQLRAARIVQRDRQRDDISDPIGGDLDRFQRVGDAIAASLMPLLSALSAHGSGAHGRVSGANSSTGANSGSADNGNSGTHGTNATNGTYGTSATNGTHGTSATNGTYGTSATNGTHATNITGTGTNGSSDSTDRTASATDTAPLAAVAGGLASGQAMPASLNAPLSRLPSAVDQ